MTESELQAKERARAREWLATTFPLTAADNAAKWNLPDVLAAYLSDSTAGLLRAARDAIKELKSGGHGRCTANNCSLMALAAELKQFEEG